MGSNSKPHLLAVPFSVPGHVKPLMNLCYRIAAEGIRVTFVTTESIHANMVKPEEEGVGIPLTFTSVPDGLDNDADRGDIVKFGESIKRAMPSHLMELVQKINLSENQEPITAVIADAAVGWVLEIAEKIGAQEFAFWLVAPGALTFLSRTPKLNEVAIRNGDGDTMMEKMMLEMAMDTQKTMQRVKSILCNTFYDLDSLSCELVPQILPVGPLKTLSTCQRILPEDTACLEWLDRQQTSSVIYVAFGGSGVLSQHQFHELALGLELAGRPFLWVVRSNLVDGSPIIRYPNGFLERVSDHGKIVEWAPQEKVLAHPATAGFMSHCGWNSIMEGISFGVPFLCWPYSGEQFFNQHYISDVFKVSLKFDADENVVKSREEIRTKIEMLLSNDDIKANALKLKNLAEKSISKEGSSCQNLQSFIKQLRH